MHPYKYDIANYLETISLSCLLMVLNGLNYDNMEAFILVFAFVPFICFVFVACKLFYDMYYKGLYKEKLQSNNALLKEYLLNEETIELN